MLLEFQYKTITDSTSPLSFELTDGNGVFWVGDRSVWDRLLTLNGQPIFKTGVICDTCACFFEKLAGDRLENIATGEKLAAKLQHGVASLDDEIIESAQKLIPNGNYAVTLSQSIPQLCHAGSQEDYFFKEQPPFWELYPEDGYNQANTDYYRLRTTKTSMETLLIECLVPMQATQNLDMQRVEEYCEQIRAGEVPTVLALSVEDTKFPSVQGIDADPDLDSHTLLAHYIIDGHHKAYAAAMLNKPISIISFLDMQRGGFGEDNGFGTGSNYSYFLSQLKKTG